VEFGSACGGRRIVGYLISYITMATPDQSLSTAWVLAPALAFLFKTSCLRFGEVQIPRPGQLLSLSLTVTSLAMLGDLIVSYAAVIQLCANQAKR